MKKLILIPVICLVFAACKKDKEEPPVPGLAGYWKGKFSYYNENYPSEFIAVLFRPDSTMRAYMNPSGDTTGSRTEGRYRLKGDSVIADFVITGAPFNAHRTIKAVVNPKFSFMEGATFLTPSSRLGPMYMVKQ